MRLSSGGGDKPNTASTMLIDGTQSQKSWLLPSAAAAIISVLPSFFALLLLCDNLIRITVLVILRSNWSLEKIEP